MWKCCPCFAKTYEAPEVLELDYRHSSLSEVPPDIFTFERTLEKLDLGSNQISDLPPSLFHCHELKELDLCDNDLMSIPQAVGSLTRLCKLDLSRNAITDIADSIKNCKNLVYFDLSMNHLTKLPEGISQLVNLEELFLNDTYLEFLHANFGRLTKLKVLELRENAIQTLPKSMSRLHHLQRLDVGQNDLAELPEVVGTMTSLTELWCDNNSIRLIPKFIGNLTKLNCLDASQNEIQEIGEEISKCTQLSDVTLNINGLEALPNSFTRLENISVLRLDCNSLSYLPVEFGNLKNLQELSIVGNILKALPASMGLLRKLHTLYLDDNLLTSIPKEIGSCTSLTVLSLAKNRLAEIPSEVGHLSSLKVLTLSGNLIVHLPVSILNITKLGALWLSESQSKPLLQLNKEIDPASGQHVLTCYLLPQLPFNGDETRRYIEEPKEKLPRRSKPSIKFLTDVEPAVIESNVNKRGLLRAPTPYPKELRALAKHASHIRQSKELNGDVVNTDEPEYEGDYPEDQPGGSGNVDMKFTRPNSVQNTDVVNSPVRKETPSVPNSSYSSYRSNFLTSSSTSKVEYKSPLPIISGMDSYGLPGTPPSTPTSTNITKGYPSTSSSVYTHPLSSSSSSSGTVSSYLQPTSSLLGQDNAETGKQSDNTAGSAHHETRFSGLPDGPDKASRENYGASATEMAKKSPPPYHVAARRAAFFRSSGGAGSGGMGSPTPVDVQQGHVRASPIIGRIFPLPLPTDTMLYKPPSSVSPSVISSTSDTASNNQTEDQGQQGKNTPAVSRDVDEGQSEMVTNLKSTCTIVSKDIDDSDVVSSMEENLDKGSSLDLDKRNFDSKNLVKTIESALESVDKRTTEFLRDDRWEDQEDLDQPNFPPPPSEDAILYSNTSPKNGVDQIDSSVKTRSNIPSGIPGYNSIYNTSTSNKGPAVPPKPSPLLSRHKLGEVNTSLDGSCNISQKQSETHSKIPTFGLTYSKVSNSQLPVTSSIVNNNYNVTTSSFDHSHQAEGRSSAIANDTEKNSGLSNQYTIPGGSLSSRIPKLPTLSTSFQVNSSVVRDPSSQFQFKKPEILSPKPSITRSITPSRIPSFSESDPKFKEEPITQLPPPQFAAGNSTNKSSLMSPKFSSLGKSNIASSTPENRSFNINSSTIPAADSNANINTSNSISGTRIPRLGHDPSPEKHELKRTGSGTRIPKFNDNSRTASPAPGPPLSNNVVDNAGYIPENNNEADTGLSNIPSTGISRIPSLGKKPWIFGTHKNARVVAVEFKKINSLGFSISEAPGAGHTLDGQGIYVVGTDAMDSAIKVGDKILQVDGIDVANMKIEIVKKILSNCQENINLLVSRQS